jgi:hypothetical protein
MTAKLDLLTLVTQFLTAVMYRVNLIFNGKPNAIQLPRWMIMTGSFDVIEWLN